MPPSPYIKSGNEYIHVRVVEARLGRKLVGNEEVHHIDGNPRNNDPSNLLVCSNHAEHMRIHAMNRVYRAGGNPELHKICKICRLVLPKESFSFQRSWDGRAAACRMCTNARRRGKRYKVDRARQSELQRIRRARKKEQ